VAIVGGLSALGGAVAGGVAALIAATVLTPSEPMSVDKVALMAIEYGLVAGLAGAVLGTLVAFGALRRVALGRLILCTNVGLAAGLTAGWVGGPWAWHHMGFLGFVGFSAGALLAQTVFRRSPVPGSGLPLDAMPESATIASESHEALRMSQSPVERLVPTDTLVERIRVGSGQSSNASIARLPANER
jgi:hypothetical protein